MDRITLTKIFLNQWGQSIDEANVVYYSKKWWKNNRIRNNSFSLSDEGLDFLQNELKLKFYTIPFNESIQKSPQTIVYLNRFIDTPYYLSDKSLIVFSERQSLEMYLFSDDIRKYGIIKVIEYRNKLERKRKRKMKKQKNK